MPAPVEEKEDSANGQNSFYQKKEKTYAVKQGHNVDDKQKKGYPHNASVNGQKNSAHGKSKKKNKKNSGKRDKK